MLGKALGGGAITAVTTALKFAIVALGLSAFWTGMSASLMYAASFVVIQLLHFTLATKQPAMTAPAMAAKLKELDASDAIGAFVDEVALLVRSQSASVLGNVLMVVPVVVLINGLIMLVSSQPMLSAAQAQHVLHSLSLWGPTLLWAAFTGGLLFVASLMAGWAENWFVLNRLESAMRYNPRITAALGNARAAVMRGL
jgi:site-specific recombinase